MWIEDEQPELRARCVEVRYRLACRSLPVEHAEALFTALADHLPWLRSEGAVHSIHGAADGNGWERPDAAAGQTLQLSRRTRLRLRIPRERAAQAAALAGTQLDVAGHALALRSAERRELLPEPTLFARRVVCTGNDEAALLASTVQYLDTLGVKARKLMCGRASVVTLKTHRLETRALMIAELAPEDSLRIQDAGMGEYQHLGCGLFAPHKNIAPVA